MPTLSTPTYSTRALVLKRSPYRAFDTLVTAYSRDKGKLRFLIRGGLKFNSKMSAHSEPFNLVDLMIIAGRRDYAASLVSQRVYACLKSDYEKLEAAGYALSSFNKLIKEDVQDPHLFDHALDFLTFLDKTEANREVYQFLSYVFLLKVLKHLGYGLDHLSCRQCQKALGENTYLLPKEGGWFCADCSLSFEKDLSLVINLKSLFLLRKTQDSSFSALPDLTIVSHDIIVLNKALKEWLDYLIE